MSTNNVPPVLQMFTGSSAVKSLPPVKIENHHGTWTPLFIDDCCLGGFGGLWGSHTGNALDTTGATNVYEKQDWGAIFEGGLKGWMTNFFAGSWPGAQQIGYTAMPSLAAGFLGGVGNIVKNPGSIFSNV